MTVTIDGVTHAAWGGRQFVEAYVPCARAYVMADTRERMRLVITCLECVDMNERANRAANPAYRR